MAYRVDAAEDPMQPPGLDRAGDFSIRDAESPDLTAADHALLATRKPGKVPLPIGASFGPHGFISRTAVRSRPLPLERCGT